MRTNNSTVTWTGAATKSMGATITSDPFPVRNMDLGVFYITVSASTSPVGTFTLEGCVDQGEDPGTGNADITGLNTWVAMTGYSQAITNDGTTAFRVVDVAERWLRVKYTRTSGSGTVAVRVNAKGRAA